MRTIDVASIKFRFLKLEQPAGTMYIGTLKADEIDSIATINRISEENYKEENIQRNENKKRIKEISRYAERPDAVFPTPIILSGKSSAIELDSENKEFTFKENARNSFSIIDGQHRLLGIKDSKAFATLELPVVIFLDTEPYEDAMIFITINGNQVKVPMSIIYQLFEIMPGRSIEKTCHTIAQAFNTDEKSPFYNRLKMLGTKTEIQDFAPLSQSSFITPIKVMLEKNGKFETYFNAEQDNVIYKILFNYFTAVSKAFKEDWNNSESILPKAIGHKALIDLLDKKLYEQGQEEGKLTEEFFFNKLKKISDVIDKPITSTEYGSSYGGAGKLYKTFINYLEN